MGHWVRFPIAGISAGKKAQRIARYPFFDKLATCLDARSPIARNEWGGSCVGEADN